MPTGLYADPLSSARLRREREAAGPFIQALDRDSPTRLVPPRARRRGGRGQVRLPPAGDGLARPPPPRATHVRAA
eukprot:scaffold2462_cov402-Prasinococcus_capsulatus_cf.AAC.23